MSALATTTEITIGDITRSLDQENLYNPLNELKFKTEQVYVKLIKLIEESYPEFLLPGSESGKVLTTDEMLASINAALASIDSDGTGTQRFVELKMIIQMYADLLHEIAEGTLSSSDQTINTLLSYAKKLAGLFDDMFNSGINIIKKYKGYAAGDYRYIKKYLSRINPVTATPNDLLDLTELDDSIVPLVIYNVRNKIRDDSIFWDDGELTLEEQQAYLLTGMKAMEFKRKMEKGDEGGAKFLAMLKYIFENTNFIDKKTADLTKEALKGYDVKSLLTTAENIINNKREELKSLDDIERDDGAASTIYAADHIQADYYNPGEFFQNILEQIFKSVGKAVPPNLLDIAYELDAKIVKSVPDEAKDKVIPITRDVKVGAHGAATPTIEMESTHPFRGVNLRSVKARSFLEHVLKKEIFKHIIQTSPVITAPKTSNLIIATGNKIKVKRDQAKSFYNNKIKAEGEDDMDDKTLDILIGQMRSDAIKSLKVIRTFDSDLMRLHENLKNNVDDINMEVLKNVLEIIERYNSENDVSQFKARGEEVIIINKRITELLQTPARDNIVKAALRRIKGLCANYLTKLQEHKDRERIKQQARREAVAGRVGRGGKRNTKKQKKNQKKKTMKAPHKRTIKKRKRRKNKTSKNRS